MISLKRAKVSQIKHEKEGLQHLEIQRSDGVVSEALCYTELTGPVAKGNEVVVNTIAYELNLGSGGKDFVLYNLYNLDHRCKQQKGHIIKLRYTPLQFSVLAAEEYASPHHHELKKHDSITGMPVVVGSLHSMLAPAALSIKMKGRDLKVVYIMSDGGALPLTMSNIVEDLKEKNIIDATITYGNAFGGDWEAINIYSSLLVARHCLKADVAIVIMGPGIVGTDTKWGFSGVEQGEIINAVITLNGTAIAIPRIMFNDPRKRHIGLSHHTLTVLRDICKDRCTVSLPKLNGAEKITVYRQIIENDIGQRFNYIVNDGTKVFPLADKMNITFNVMGRTRQDEPHYFATAASAGMIAAQYLFNEG